MSSACGSYFQVCSCCRLLLALGCFPIFACSAVEAAAKRSYQLPADEAANALKLFSQQSGAGVIAGTDVVKGVRTNAVQGELTASEALHRMLDGTGLVGSEDRESGTFAVRKAAEENGKPAAQPAGDRSPVKKKQMNLQYPPL